MKKDAVGDQVEQTAEKAISDKSSRHGISRRTLLKGAAAVGLGSLALGEADAAAPVKRRPKAMSSALLDENDLLVIEVPAGQAGNVYVVESPADGGPEIKLRVSSQRATLVGVIVE